MSPTPPGDIGGIVAVAHSTIFNAEAFLGRAGRKKVAIIVVYNITKGIRGVKTVLIGISHKTEHIVIIPPAIGACINISTWQRSKRTAKGAPCSYSGIDIVTFHVAVAIYQLGVNVIGRAAASRTRTCGPFYHVNYAIIVIININAVNNPVAICISIDSHLCRGRTISICHCVGKGSGISPFTVIGCKSKCAIAI